MSHAIVEHRDDNPGPHSLWTCSSPRIAEAGVRIGARMPTNAAYPYSPRSSTLGLAVRGGLRARPPLLPGIVVADRRRSSSTCRRARSSWATPLIIKDTEIPAYGQDGAARAPGRSHTPYCSSISRRTVLPRQRWTIQRVDEHQLHPGRKFERVFAGRRRLVAGMASGTAARAFALVRHAGLAEDHRACTTPLPRTRIRPGLPRRHP